MRPCSAPDGSYRWTFQTLPCAAEGRDNSSVPVQTWRLSQGSSSVLVHRRDHPLFLSRTCVLDSFASGQMFPTIHDPSRLGYSPLRTQPPLGDPACTQAIAKRASSPWGARTQTRGLITKVKKVQLSAQFAMVSLFSLLNSVKMVF